MARRIASEAGVPMIHVPAEAVASKWYGQVHPTRPRPLPLAHLLAHPSTRPLAHPPIRSPTHPLAHPLTPFIVSSFDFLLKSEKQLAAAFKAAESFERGCVIFFDEIDSLAGSRGAGEMHEATRRMLGVLLRQLDGFVPTSKVVVLAATNRREDLDRALLSRFALTVHFPLPSAPERAAILGEFARHLPERDRSGIADECAGMSGRDLRAVCEEAERAWSAAIIRGDRVKGSLPDAKAYARAIERRRRLGTKEDGTAL